jgi:hypothetical protein
MGREYTRPQRRMMWLVSASGVWAVALVMLLSSSGVSWTAGGGAFTVRRSYGALDYLVTERAGVRLGQRGGSGGPTTYDWRAGRLAATLVLAGIATWLSVLMYRWGMTRDPLVGRCDECGYDLRGSAGGVCPECGAGAQARREGAATESQSGTG